MIEVLSYYCEVIALRNELDGFVEVLHRHFIESVLGQNLLLQLQISSKTSQRTSHEAQNLGVTRAQPHSLSRRGTPGSIEST